MQFRSLSLVTLVALTALLACGTRTADGQHVVFPDDAPAQLEGVGVTERLGDSIPLDLVFRDETGREVALREYFAEGRPVLLTLNFFRCQMLCNLTLNGVLDSVRTVDWTAGEEYEIVTVSFAPEEGPELAAAKAGSYLSSYGRGEAVGWHFLTGTEASIRTLTDSVGFGYKRIESDDIAGGYDYAHSSSIIYLTPDGKISRYMNDVMFDPADVRLALVEASEGAIGTPVEKFLLFTCFRYDPEANSYAMSAVKLMRLAAALTLVLIGAGLMFLRLRSPRVKIDPAEPAAPVSDAPDATEDGNEP